VEYYHLTLIWHFFNKILKFIQYNNLYLQGEDLVPEPKIIIAALQNKQLFYVISSVSYQTETITDVITLADATLKTKICNYSIISFSYSHSKSYILATVNVL
jgi:uncharacterized protein YjfI (DUF2170 family)